MQHADEDSEHQGAGVEVDGQRLARDAVGQLGPAQHRDCAKPNRIGDKARPVGR